MKYFFVLGNNPTLSVAELAAVFNIKETKFPIGNLVSDYIFILETKEKINPNTINRLGGTIKIGQVVGGAQNNTDKLLTEVKKILEPKNGKFKFGISNYSKVKINTKALAMEIKKYLREKKISCRWVTSKEKVLSSVVVEQNKLIPSTGSGQASKGLEIVLIDDKRQIIIGKTLAVQPFKQLSKRDYGRPARDDLSGMLPPKLAQIMINLALAPSPCQGEGRGEVILDPFCGSGTILTEAMLMGYQNLIGSDISQKAINDTKTNISWVKSMFHVSGFKFQVFNKNATELSSFIKPLSINAIITEPYLGPQRGKYDIIKVVKDLELLYSKAIAQFKQILKPNGEVVMIFPVFKKNIYLNPNLKGFKIITPIIKNLQKNSLLKLTKRNTIIYGRPGQKVWREIVILAL